MARTIATAVLLALSVLAGCGDGRLPEYELSGPVMGTTFSVKLVNPASGSDLEAIRAAITGRLEEIEQQTSTYRPGSELSRLNGALTTEWVPVSEALCGLVERAVAISRYTGGAFDVTVGPLVLLWGFGPDGDRTAPPAASMIAEARGSVGFDKLETDCALPAIRKALPGVSIDLSAFAKGYAVDQLAKLLDDQGMDNFLVEIGGELYARGLNAAGAPWAIAIEKPDPGARGIQSIVNVSDRGMATSGDYRNYFMHEGVRYSHTIDPGTGRPVTHDTAAVTVIDESAADADALATALLVMGEDRGMAMAEKENIAAYFLLRTETGVEERSSAAFDTLVSR